MYDCLPQELKEYPYFCEWKYEVKAIEPKYLRALQGIIPIQET